eukprot:2933904-Amphidinium_carterae.1
MWRAQHVSKVSGSNSRETRSRCKVMHGIMRSDAVLREVSRSNIHKIPLKSLLLTSGAALKL